MSLRAPNAAVEAFADLVAGVHRGGAHFVDLQVWAEALESALEAGGRPPSEACGMLAGVLDDCAFDLVIDRHALGAPFPTTFPSPNLAAGLTVRERLEMCKRLLGRGPVLAEQIVWLAYENARLDPWLIEFNNLVFFDGPALLGAREVVAAGTGIPVRDKIPAELLHPKTQTNFRWSDCKHWVAGRITLPGGSLCASGADSQGLRRCARHTGELQRLSCAVATP